MSQQEIIKTRFKNRITTGMGVVSLMFSLFFGYADVMAFIKDKDIPFSATEIIFPFLLAYALIMAKDTLIEGLTLGFLKMKQ